MKLFNPDAAAEKLLRRFAGGTSRRGMLARLGGALDLSDPGESSPVSFVASRSRSTKSDSSSFDDIRKNYPSPVKL